MWALPVVALAMKSYHLRSGAGTQADVRHRCLYGSLEVGNTQDIPGQMLCDFQLLDQ